MDIEKIVELFERIVPARENHWNVETVVPSRVHLTKSDDGLFAIFIEGAKESFGPMPALSAIQHSDAVVALPDRRRVSAMRITAGIQPHANRVLAHIAYELSWRLRGSPQPDNQTLVRDIGWLLSLLALQDVAMSPEKQKGLVGECMLLRTLLLHCKKRGCGSSLGLQVWQGFDSAKRDFYSKGVAIEAKATAASSRLHHISSLDQLAPQEAGEVVYMYSVGIRQDPTAPRKLTNYVEDVETLLVDERGKADATALSQFRKGLASYGFDWALRGVYERQSGFLAPHLPPALFKAADLRALSESDFVDGKVPETVRSISYELEVVASPLSREESETVFDRILQRKP